MIICCIRVIKTIDIIYFEGNNSVTGSEKGVMSDQDYNKKYNDLGNEIKDSVMDAINSGDFSGLSDAVSKSVYTVLGDVGDSINKATNQVRNVDWIQAYQDSRDRAKELAERYHKEQEESISRNKAMREQAIKKTGQVVKFKRIGTVSGPLSVVGGISGTILGGVFVALSITGEFMLSMLVIGGAMVAIFGGMIASGVKKKKLLEKALRYKKLASEKMYCAVDDIASATGTDQKKVVKDIKKILEKGFFPEGYIDDEGTTFMVSKSVYDQYTQTKKYREENAHEIVDEQEESNTGNELLTPEQQAELSTMMSEGKKSITRLHELNDNIPGEIITNKLNITEKILEDIFKRLGEHPEQMKNCHKLMDYHLPTMLKLVEAYAEYDKVSVPGPEIIKAKEEIEKTIDVINEAFTELLNRMFQDSVWDVTADAKVLKSMLTQEGLAKDI